MHAQKPAAPSRQQQQATRCSAPEWHAGFRGQTKPVAKEKDREKESEKERDKERERDRDKVDAGSESSHELAHHPKTERAKW